MGVCVCACKRVAPQRTRQKTRKVSCRRLRKLECGLQMVFMPPGDLTHPSHAHWLLHTLLAIRNGNTGAPGEQGERLPKLTSDPHIYLESLLSTTLTTVDSTHARPRSVASLGAPPLGRGVPGAWAPSWCPQDLLRGPYSCPSEPGSPVGP